LVADEVDAAVDDVQAFSVHSPIDLAGRHSFGEQLAPCDHAVLPARQPRDHPVNLNLGPAIRPRSTLTTVWVVKFTFTENA
jgi:hypothetical protein